MNEKRYLLSFLLVVWTGTIVSCALWVHGAPFAGSLVQPTVYQKLSFSDLSYSSESPDWRIKRYDLEGLKEKLRSGRPIDVFVLSALQLSITGLDRLSPTSTDQYIDKLLANKELVKYRPVSATLSTKALARESRLEAFAPNPPLSPQEQRRINADLLASWYPLEFEKIPPKPTVVLLAPPQPLGFMKLKLRFKAQREESAGVLFQTANENHGIRLELTKILSGTTALKVVSGWKNAPSGLDLGPANDFFLSEDLDPDEEHEVELTMDGWGNLSAIVDGNYIGKLDSQHPMLDKITLGNGYNSYRPFWGHIQLEHLEVSSVEKTVPRNVVFVVRSYLGIVLFLANIVSFLKLFPFLLQSL